MGCGGPHSNGCGRGDSHTEGDDMTRDRKALIAMKRQEVDDTFFDRDEDARMEAQEVLAEMQKAWDEDDGNERT